MGKREGVGEDKHFNQYSILRPGTSVRTTLMQNIYTN